MTSPTDPASRGGCVLAWEIIKGSCGRAALRLFRGAMGAYEQCEQRARRTFYTALFQIV